MASQRKLVQHDNDPWGWVMVGTMFLVFFITLGNMKALGVLLIAIHNDFDSDLWLIGWIAVMYNMVSYFFAPLVAAVTRIVGSRLVIVTGGLMASLGMVVASQSSSVIQLAVSIVVAGLGKSCCVFPTWGVMASFFKEKYALAIAISGSSVPISFIVYGPVTQVLLDTYGWRGAILLLGGINFHLVVCGALVRKDPSSPEASQYQEVPASDTEEANAESPAGQKHNQRKWKSLCQRLISSMDFAVMANSRLVLLSLARCACDFCFSGWLVFMVSHGQFLGLGEVQASFLPAAFGAGSIIGKVLPTLVEKIHFKLSMSIWACVGSGLMSAFFIADAFLKPFVGQMVVTFFVGVGNGMQYQANDVMIRFLSPSDDRMVNILSWTVLFSGIAGMTGGFFTGWIYEWTGSFQTALIMYCGIMFVSMLLYMMNYLLYDKNQQQDEADDD